MCFPNHHLDTHKLVLAFLRAVQNLPAADLLPARTGRGTLRSDLLRLELLLLSDDFDLDCIKPLIRSAIADDTDTLIWNQVYNVVTITESTPPPQPIASSVRQTPWLHSTGSFANSSKSHQGVDKVLKLELGPLYVGLPCFCKTYFRRVASLKIAAKAVFKECIRGSNPLFNKR